MWLRVLTGRRARLLVEITGPRFTVGSDPGCDLVLDDPSVAPHHAAFEVRPEDGGLTLVDLGSEEGTFVETRRIRPAVELAGTEELCFGWVFAELLQHRPAARKRRRGLAVAAIVLGVLVIAAALLGILNVGGGGDPPAAPPAPQAAPAQAPAEQPRAGNEPAQETLPFAGGAIEDTTTEEATEPSTESTVETPAGTEAASPAGTTGEPPAETQAEEEPAAPEQPVVWRDDFSDSGSGWEVFDAPGASAAYEDGSLVLDVKQPGFFATSDSGKAFAEPLVRVAARNPGGSTDAALGVLCRYRDQENFIVLAVGTDGTAAIVRSKAGELTVLTNDGAWLRTPRVPVGASTYALRAECTDERLRLSVDGRPVLSHPAGAGSGRVGLFAAGEGRVAFDALRVTDPAA